MSPFLRAVEGDPAEPRPEAAIRLVVDGKPVEALPGQTVAAALLASGRDSWRTTRREEKPRGVLCGIGACFDCLVTVNGIPDVRACQRTIAPEDTITTQPGATLPTPHTAASPPEPSTSSAVPSASPSPSERRSSAGVVVVGAGPAGMAAALAAAEAGADVVLVDAGRAVGGQFHRQLPAEFHARRPERLHHGWTTFAEQRDRIAAHPQITHLHETSVWAIEPLATGHRLWVQTGPADAPGRTGRAIDARSLVLATGAYDRVLPFPGWDLPGVYSAGAAQALAKGQRVAVGRRVLVSGTGPFLLPVAESLLGVGAEVLALLEANRPTTVLKGWLTDPLVASSKFKEAIGYAALLGRRRIPLKYGRAVVAAHGTDRVEAVTVARLDAGWRPIRGYEQQLEVDAVCLGFGFTAQLELAVSARCELGPGPDGGAAVLVDADQQTSVPGVFAAGELTGIGGAALAATEGHLAGTTAATFAAPAASAGPGTGVDAAAPGGTWRGDRDGRDRREVVRGRRFVVALGKAYPVRDGWRSWSDGSTLLCRCEEVTRDDLQEAVDARGVGGARGLKLTSRAGLGLCQGRVCSRTVAELAAAHQPAAHQPGVRAEPTYNRPIAVPIRLRDLAATETQEDL